MAAETGSPHDAYTILETRRSNLVPRPCYMYFNGQVYPTFHHMGKGWICLTTLATYHRSVLLPPLTSQEGSGYMTRVQSLAIFHEHYPPACFCEEMVSSCVSFWPSMYAIITLKFAT